MSNLSQQRAAAANAGPRRPAHVINIEPGEFADGWPSKPRVAVKAGVRVVAEFDLVQAKAEAAKTAWRFYPEEGQFAAERVEVFNDALIHWGVARGICSAQDVAQPFLSLDEDNVAEVFSPPAILRLWDEVIRVSELGSPLAREMSPEERAELAARLAAPGEVDPQTSRMLLWCLRRLRGV